MNLRRSLVCSHLLVALALGGCVSPKGPISPHLNRYSLPSLDQVSEAELGDSIMSKTRVWTYPALHLLHGVSAGSGKVGEKWSVPAGILGGFEQDAQYIYYYSDEFSGRVQNIAIGIGALRDRRGGLRVSKTDSRDAMVFVSGSYQTKEPDDSLVFELIEANALDEPNFRQELIYNGRVGSSVKFLYRELVDDLLRTAFTQEIQYDWEEGQTIGFKGARVELLEATNTKLKYRVLSNFPD